MMTVNRQSSIVIRRSPDLQAIFDYFEALADRVDVCNKTEDPDFTDLVMRLMRTPCTYLYSHERYGDVIVLEPGDEMLDLVAKLRALERVLYSRR